MNAARWLEISLPTTSTAEAGSGSQSATESLVQVSGGRTQRKRLSRLSFNEVVEFAPTCASRRRESIRTLNQEPLENAKRRKTSKVVIECSFCSNFFDGKTVLKKHEKVCQNNLNRVVFKCSRCGIEFAKKAFLSLHSEDFH